METTKIQKQRENSKEYYKNNKEEMNKKRLEDYHKIKTIKCNCGGKYKDTPSLSHRHFETTKHQVYCAKMELEEEKKRKEEYDKKVKERGLTINNEEPYWFADTYKRDEFNILLEDFAYKIYMEKLGYWKRKEEEEKKEE